jgi:lysophospholipase L1-like esterase
VAVRLLLLLAALLLAGCTSVQPEAPPPVSWGRADFSSYVAMGTSVSMGIESGGLLDENQRASAPALIAQQAGANGGTFVQPLVAFPGIPPLLHLASLVPLTLDRLPGTPPAGPYVARPAGGYDNLAISGALLADAIAKEAGAPYFDLVLQGHGTMLRQTIAQGPTFISIELGANDAILPLVEGGDLSLLLPPAAFAAQYAQLLDSLALNAPQARLALANVPQVTHLPYATTVPLDAAIPGVGLVRLHDAAGPLPDGSLILLPAIPLIRAGIGIGPPLPDSLVITLAERAAIEGAVAGYNQAIAAEAQARGAALVDQFALFERLAQTGVLVSGVHFSFRYVTGGLFGLDGIHPSPLGSALLANTFIEAINATFGARIPPADLGAAPNPYSGDAERLTTWQGVSTRSGR